jgi:hypothetical protein
LQRDRKRLERLYGLPLLCGKVDPLNAKAMAQARSEKFDPPNYRGLGTRTGPSERGRVLQLFLEYTKSTKPKITAEMCIAAIEFFNAQSARKNAEKARKEAFG